MRLTQNPLNQSESNSIMRLQLIGLIALSVFLKPKVSCQCLSIQCAEYTYCHMLGPLELASITTVGS